MTNTNNSHVNVKDAASEENNNNKVALESNDDRLSCSISNIELTTGNNEIDHHINHNNTN